MFQSDSPSYRLWRISISTLAALSLMSLGLSCWLLVDFRHEKRIVEKIALHLPASDVPQARELAQELRLQSRLSVLLVINVLASTIALALLTRAYLSSERHLRRVRVQAQDILTSLGQGIITVGHDGTLLSTNPRGQELVGLDESDLGQCLNDLPEPHLALENLHRSFIENPNCTEEIEYLVDHDGQAQYLHAGCDALRDHDKRNVGMVIYVRDDSERVLIQQQLLRMERYMGLGSLAAGLQHEIKNPLSALSLHVQLIREQLAETTELPAVQEELEVLTTEVGRINSVLENFRDFASVQLLDRSPTSIRGMLQQVAKLMSIKASEQNVRLFVDSEVDNDLVLMIDPVRMEQVLINLIVNALAAMPSGGTCCLRIVFNEGISIEVSDTGSGIPEEAQDRIYDPYFTTKTSGGTGMGLALSEKIIRQHGGAIRFTTGDTGTTFFIELPCDLVSQEPVL